MEILEEIEAELQQGLLGYVTHADANARQNVSAILSNFLVKWDAYPLLKRFGQEEYMVLVRKLPPARVQAHGDRDATFINNFVAKLTQEGITMRASPQIVTNLMKSLFFVGLHRAELGDAAYAETMEVLVDLVAGYVTEGGR